MSGNVSRQPACSSTTRCGHSLCGESRPPAADPAKVGGGRGIRTPGTLPGTVVFKTTAIDHSAIPPAFASVHHSAGFGGQARGGASVHHSACFGGAGPLGCKRALACSHYGNAVACRPAATNQVPDFFEATMVKGPVAPRLEIQLPSTRATSGATSLMVKSKRYVTPFGRLRSARSYICCTA